MRCRVVWGRGVTMLSFSPTSAFNSVDLPTLGRPTRAAKPLRNSSVMLDIVQYSLGRLLLGSPAARARALRSHSQLRHFAGHVESLGVRLALRPVHPIAWQRISLRLQILLQAGLG